jgi:hypothetical protein
MRVREQLSDLKPNDIIAVRWRDREQVAHVMGRRDDGRVFAVIEDTVRNVMGATIEVTDERYVCSFKHDPAFEKWWASPERPGHLFGDDSPFAMASLAWDAARTPHSTLESLAIAILHGDDSALLPLVDRLIEQGKLPNSASPNGQAVVYRKALEDCIDACRRWSAGMDEIYEFIEARKLLGEIVEEGE